MWIKLAIITVIWVAAVIVATIARIFGVPTEVAAGIVCAVLAGMAIWHVVSDHHR